MVLLIAPTPSRGLRARIVSDRPKIIIKLGVHGGHTSAREYMVGTCTSNVRRERRNYNGMYDATNFPSVILSQVHALRGY
jgi:hypothetical protein